jgi:HEAT repeat protein
MTAEANGPPPARGTATAAREQRTLTAEILRRALEMQRRVFDATGRWIRLGEVLLLRGDLHEEDVADLQGSALFPGDGAAAAEVVGEAALRLGLLDAARYLECLQEQAADRRARRERRPIGTILVQRGFLKPRDLETCEAELRREARLHAAEAKRAGRAGSSDRPALGPVDAQYVRAAKRGALQPQQVVAAISRLQSLQKLLGRRIALWEDLLVREVVAPAEHQRVLDRTVNVRDDHFGASWLLGGILVELGYATAEQVEAALEQRAAEAAPGGGPPRALGEILVERGVVSLTELEEALRIQAFRRSADPREQARRRLRRRAAAAALVVLVAAAALAAWPVVRLQRAEAVLADTRASAEERIAAGAVLSAEGGERALAALARTAEDRAAPLAVRLACLRAIGTLPLEGVRDLVRRALSDPAAEVRALAAWTLGDRRDAFAREALRDRFAEDPAPAVRLAAARSLALLGSSDGREALVSALRPERPDRGPLAAALGLSPGEVGAAIGHALEALSGFRLGDASERWQLWLSLQPVADEVCGKARGPSAAARFVTLLESERLSVRFSAARALAHLGDPRGIPVLIRALDPGDAAFREALALERGIDLDRLSGEIASLLSLLTGRSFGTDHAAWRSWFEAAPRDRAGGSGGGATGGARG